MIRAQWWAAATLSLTAAACAAIPVPAERLASAEAAVRAAKEVGAEESPQAALHLTLAREKVARAKALIARGQNEDVAGLLARAEADAELSLAQAKQVSARRDADAVLAEVRALKETPR